MPKYIKIGLISTLMVTLCLIVADLLFPFQVRIDYSTTVYDKDGNLVNAFLSGDDKWRLRLGDEEITSSFKKAILYKEDQYFYYHPGVNPVAILRAAYQNISSGTRKSGASTITMQLARLLNPKQRTYGNKIMEIFNALQLEWHYSKDEILRLYLNLLPYGGNIEGLKSATVLYFQKNPDALSLSEIAALSIIPNRPSSLAIGRNNDQLNIEKNIWLNRFQEGSVFDNERIQRALSEPLNPRRKSPPKEIPHLAYRLKAILDESVINTMIDLSMQQKSEMLLKSHVERLRQRGIQNGSVVIINNQTHGIVTYVGSADFYDTRDGGQVDGITAVRSPGSTLKPLLYGLMFDQGKLTPKSGVEDVSMNFDGYRPVNYDEEFHGLVSAEESLINSYNIPAVKLLDEYGVQEFVEKLKLANFETVAAHEEILGLSTILGGCGATLEELTRLYASFATGGVLFQLDYTPKLKRYDSLRILDPGAAFMLTDVLSKVVRPDLPDQWQDSPNMPKIAWKTGTSFGRRDAWSIGYNRDFTVGVWMGNFSGKGVPDLSGSEVAAPVLFDVFYALEQSGRKPEWYQQPANVEFKWVCSETGKIPQQFCENTVMDYYIKDKTIYHSCDHMRPILVSQDSSTSYCQTCVPSGQAHHIALYPHHSPEIVDFLLSEQIEFMEIPPHYPYCERVYPNNGLSILSPTDNMEYFIDKSDSLQMMLKAVGPEDISKFYWYVNDIFYQTSEPNKPIYLSPPEGIVKISCSDDRGRNKDITVKVKGVRF